MLIWRGLEKPTLIQQSSLTKSKLGHAAAKQKEKAKELKK